MNAGWATLQGPLSAEHGAGRSTTASTDIAMGIGYTREFERAIDAAARWAKRTTRPDGTLVADDPVFLDRLGTLVVETEAGRVTPGPMGRNKASLSFIAGIAELIDLVGPEALLAHGADGAIEDGVLDFAHRFAQGTATYGGTTEVFKGMIAQHVLGLPRLTLPGSKQWCADVDFATVELTAEQQVFRQEVPRDAWSSPSSAPFSTASSVAAAAARTSSGSAARVSSITIDRDGCPVALDGHPGAVRRAAAGARTSPGVAEAVPATGSWKPSRSSGSSRPPGDRAAPPPRATAGWRAAPAGSAAPFPRSAPPGSAPPGSRAAAGSGSPTIDPRHRVERREIADLQDPRGEVQREVGRQEQERGDRDRHQRAALRPRSRTPAARGRPRRRPRSGDSAT